MVASTSTGRASADGQKPRGPAALDPLANSWKRISPSLVPVLAVITALLITVPFMIVTGGDGNIGKGLRISGTAYTALLEGSVGVAINRLVQVEDVNLALQFIENDPVTQRDLLLLSSRAEILATVDPENVRYYGEVLSRYLGSEALPDTNAVLMLGQAIPDIQFVGAARLREMGPLVRALAELPRGDVANLAAEYAIYDTLDDDQRAALIAVVPLAADYDDALLLDLMDFVNQRGTPEQLALSLGIVRLTRALDQLAVLETLDLDPDDDDAQAFVEIVSLGTANTPGPARINELAQAQARFEAAGITNTAALSNQLRLVLRLYDAGLIRSSDVASALRAELPAALEENLVIRRPNNRLLVDAGPKETFAIVYNNRNTPEDTSDDKPEVVYAYLGGRVFLFFPDNLEATIIRAIPFIIAGLAITLGFKAGLFNIGAEGQLFIAGTAATWVGYSTTFSQSPGALLAGVFAAGFALFTFSRWLRRRNRAASSRVAEASGLRGDMMIGGVLGLALALALLLGRANFAHLTLMLMVGILGGALWGMIPGALKAFTGAHEVISTIMLNFVAMRLVDWLIKSDDPVILLDTTATSPRTPFILDTAVLPSMTSMALYWFAAAAVLTTGIGLWRRRGVIGRGGTEAARAAVRPAVYGAAVFVGLLFLQWIAIRDAIHIGLFLMIAMVWFVDWFLERTTPGFELRTVGTNPDAARYAGMSVRWNTVLALTLSGGIVGLAGAIQISGVQKYMEPTFFGGLGFDSIAVALLARNKPRNMIAAGLLWGALLTGSGLMQERAVISNDLVKIIQALIIMFIAADAIIRYLWRVPEVTAEEKAATFSQGWGG